MRIDIFDALIIVGLLAITAGVWCISRPAGLIVAGLALVAWSALKDLSRTGGDEPEELEEE
ncbi:MAG: hypothetical protein SWK76_17050 [Actinomycetota bacterium]|nr:hypothetical protein [Actinomycetota bacterium]